MSIRSELRKLDRARLRSQKNVANAVGLGGAYGIASKLIGKGRSVEQQVARRVVGRRNLKALGLDYGRHEAGFPGAGVDALGEASCARVDAADGSVRRPYSMLCRVQLAASAQAINTSLGDFFTVAASSTITTANTIPGGFTSEWVQVFVGLNELIASPVLNPSIANGFFVIFKINGIEEARWPIAKFNPVISNNGLVTSGAGATLYKAQYEPVPFNIDFDPDKTYGLELYTTKAVTPAAVSDWTFAFEGMR